MKNLILTCLVLTLFACEAKVADQTVEADLPTSTFQNFGDDFSWNDAVLVSEVIDSSDEYLGQTVKMEGIAREVCQKKGCWMIVDGSPNGNVRVTFKDYGFFVPTNISGHRVIVEGVIDEANEGEESKHHYEKEEGMTAEQAEEVIEAGRNLAIVASGVIIEYPDGSDTDSSPDESSL